jgi:predicted small secreted protein
MNKKIIYIIMLLMCSTIFTGCQTQSIKDIKNETYIGKTVKIEGTVIESFKLGKVSGFILKDKNNDLIRISSIKLPKQKEKITVKGILMKKPISGYYIKSQ